MKNLFLLILLSGLFVLNISAQSNDIRKCGTVEPTAEELKADPELAKRISDLEEYTKEYVKNHDPNRRSGNISFVIPVVFHVIYNTPTNNISKAQCLGALNTLNEDFQKRNADTSSIVAAFKSVAGDSEIEFRLAKLDPSGNCTEGITRTFSNLTLSADDNVKDLIRWPRDKYLNIWIVQNIAGGGVAGYSQLPGSASWQADGVVILNSYFGPGIRTLTHEVGHWSNLKHCWGGTNNPGVAINCNDDDLVADTPNTIGNTGCNLNANSCGSLDNVQNYMEYAFCDRMFTIGQGVRMRAALSASTADRNNLSTLANLMATGTNDGYNANPCMPFADFSTNATMVCAGTQVNFTDITWNGDASSWAWDFPGGTPSTSTIQNPVIVYNTPGIYTVSMTAINAAGQDTKVRTNLITVSPANASLNIPFAEGFESLTFPGNNWLQQNAGGNGWAISNSTAYSGSKSMRLLNYNGNTAGTVDAFIIPGIDLSNVTGTNLNFKLSHAVKSTTGTDGLRIYASSDCGKTWSLRFAKIGTALATGGLVSTNYIPSGTPDWRDENASLASTSISTKPNVMIKFEYTYDNGNNIYIDDINISGIVGVNDAQTIDLNLNVYPNPSSDHTFVSFHLDNAQEIFVTLKDMLGRTVNHVSSKKLDAGDHQFRIDAPEVSGIYYVVIQMKDKLMTRKLFFSNQ